MRLCLYCSIAILALVTSFTLGQEDRKPTPKSSNPGQPGEQGTAQGQPAHRHDLSGFLKEHDLNKDGTLDKSELPGRLRDRFVDLDTNKDGKLTKEELEKGIAFLQPARRPADVLFVLIDMSDCDECCVEEIQHFYTMLRKLDKNNDGKLSADELAAARKTMAEERVTNLIKDLDRNEDGRISRDEARGQVRKNFDQLDVNKDGAVDREELLRGAANSSAPNKPTARPDGR